MNPNSIHESKLDYVLSAVLRTGLFLAIAAVFFGGASFLWYNGKEIIDYHIFDGEPASLKGVVNIFKSGGADKFLEIIQLGIIILIATPVMRVTSCLIVFAFDRDYLYVVLSSFVLAVLLYASF